MPFEPKIIKTISELNARYDEIDRAFSESALKVLNTESVEEATVLALNMTNEMGRMIILYREALAKVSSIVSVEISPARNVVEYNRLLGVIARDPKLSAQCADPAFFRAFMEANGILFNETYTLNNLNLQWDAFANEYLVPWVTTLTKSQNKIIWMILALKQFILPKVSNMAAAEASLTAKKALSGADVDVAPSQAEARLAIQLRQLVSSLPGALPMVVAPNWGEILSGPSRRAAQKARVLNLVKDLISKQLKTNEIIYVNNALKNMLSKLLEVAKQQVAVGGSSNVKL